jgi:hypothetical protein
LLNGFTPSHIVVRMWNNVNVKDFAVMNIASIATVIVYS